MALSVAEEEISTSRDTFHIEDSDNNDLHSSLKGNYYVLFKHDLLVDGLVAISFISGIAGAYS